MTIETWTDRGFWIALVAAVSGALVFTWLNVPAAVLVGSTCFVTIVALADVKPHVPDLLRNLGFTVIGLTLGAGVTPHFLSDIAHYPVSIFALLITMLLIIFVCGRFLEWYIKADRRTAILSTSPGALSVALALADNGRADVRTVMVLQSMRLLAITVILPPLLGFFGTAPELSHISAASNMAIIASLIMLAVAFVLGFGLVKLNVPAAFLFAGLLISGIAHGFDLVEGRPNLYLTFAGFTIAGATVGSRFAGIKAAELKKAGMAALIVTSIAVAIAALAAFIVAMILTVPFAQVLVAYAPGGVEGMAAMALALGYDPVFVATHHIFRIVALIALLPLLLRSKQR